jgi:MFS family permease
MNAQPGSAPVATTPAIRDSTTTDATPAVSTQATEQPPRGGFAALQSRNFVLLWSGLITSNAGTWMAGTAEGWLVTDLTGDRAAFSLGLIAASFAVPLLLLPPVGGVVADRVPRLKMLWAANLLYMALAVALAVVTITDVVNVGFLMAYAFFTGVVLAFDAPCRHALLPDIVTREQLTSAVSMNSAAFTGAQMVGPVLAGALIPLIGVSGVFVINAVSCVATLWALSQMRGVPQHSRHYERQSLVDSIMAGVNYVRRSRLLSGLLLMSLISGLFVRSFMPLLVVFAREIFEVGSVGFGFLSAATGFGTLAGALTLASRREISNRVRLSILATIGGCLALFLFAIGNWYAPALLFLIAVGFFSVIATSLIAAVIQLTVPGELRGRIMSLYMLTIIGIPSAGAFLSGALADLFGVQFAVAAGAVFVVALVSLNAAKNEELREAP